MDGKEIDPFWALVDPLSALDAAALIAGFEPTSVRSNHLGSVWFESENGYTNNEGGRRVTVAFTAIKNAINDGALKAIIRRTAWERGWDEEPGEGERFQGNVSFLGPDLSEAFDADEPSRVRNRGVIYRVDPDWGKTTIQQDDIRSWLAKKGFSSGFFFPAATNAADAPGFMDPNHNRRSPKLAAAFAAWNAVTDPKGKSPKQALEKWLREHAAQFGLTDEAGNPIKQAVEECAKVANWEKSGGAPKTPSTANRPTP